MARSSCDDTWRHSTGEGEEEVTTKREDWKQQVMARGVREREDASGENTEQGREKVKKGSTPKLCEVAPTKKAERGKARQRFTPKTRPIKMKERTEATEVKSAGSYVYVSGEKTPIHGKQKVKKGSIHGREKGEERLDSHRAPVSHPTVPTEKGERQEHRSHRSHKRGIIRIRVRRENTDPWQRKG